MKAAKRLKVPRTFKLLAVLKSPKALKVLNVLKDRQTPKRLTLNSLILKLLSRGKTMIAISSISGFPYLLKEVGKEISSIVWL